MNSLCSPCFAALSFKVASVNLDENVKIDENDEIELNESGDENLKMHKPHSSFRAATPQRCSARSSLSSLS